MKRRWLVVAVLGVVLAAGGFYYGRERQAPGAAAPGTARGGGAGFRRAIPVVATPAARADVDVELGALGSVTPLATVTVRSRVDGQLMKVLFREGQVVRAGELLAEIDSRPFQVQLAQAEGQLARDEALLQNARTDLERYRVLLRQDAIAAQQLDAQQALVRQTEASVKIDRAAIDSARLQLTYCRITAPIGGRLGLRQVDVGNMVHASDANGLVIITQLQPIAVVFAIPEDSLPAVLKKLHAGDNLPAAVYDRAGRTRLARGTLLTVDNQIDPATGTVKLKAQFANADGALFPSQFVNVKLRVDVKKDATVVPGAAVQRGTPGTFVYAVDPEKKTVSVRKVRLGPEQGDRVAVEQGVTPGTLVVVDGADKLREGAAVELVKHEAGPPKPPVRKSGFDALPPEERAKRWKALNERIDRGEFGEEMRKLPEEERKRRMRELGRQRRQSQ
jgi:multidrug efflux system membrane fusion protein